MHTTTPACPLYPQKRTHAAQLAMSAKGKADICTAAATSNERRRECIISSMGSAGQDRGFPVSQSSCGSASIVTHIVSKRMITAGHQLCRPDASTATPAIAAPTTQIPITRRLGGSNIFTPRMSSGTSGSASTCLSNDMLINSSSKSRWR
jgi:hypothetical protein